MEKIPTNTSNAAARDKCFNGKPIAENKMQQRRETYALRRIDCRFPRGDILRKSRKNGRVSHKTLPLYLAYAALRVFDPVFTSRIGPSASPSLSASAA